MIPNNTQQLKNSFSIETPEGITLNYQPAGFVARSLAYGIDLCCKAAIIIAFYIATTRLGNVGTGLLLIVYFIVSWFYSILFEQWLRGQSPGKKIFHLRVVNRDGTNVHWGASLARNLFRVVDAMPVLYMFGFISMIINKEFKRLGDIVADTVVIYVPKPQAFNFPPGKPEIPTTPLSIDQQQAIIGFAQRYSSLSEARSMELSALLFSGHVNAAEQTIINWAYYLCGIPANTYDVDQARRNEASTV